MKGINPSTFASLTIKCKPNINHQLNPPMKFPRFQNSDLLPYTEFLPWHLQTSVAFAAPFIFTGWPIADTLLYNDFAKAKFFFFKETPKGNTAYVDMQPKIRFKTFLNKGL